MQWDECPSDEPTSSSAALIAKLQAENRVLQLQLLERKISECTPGKANSISLEEEEAQAREDENLDVDSLDAVQLQLFTLRQQLRRERRYRLFLQKSLSQEVQRMRIWIEHNRIRHREQLLRLHSKVSAATASVNGGGGRGVITGGGSPVSVPSHHRYSTVPSEEEEEAEVGATERVGKHPNAEEEEEENEQQDHKHLSQDDPVHLTTPSRDNIKTTTGNSASEVRAGGAGAGARAGQPRRAGSIKMTTPLRSGAAMAQEREESESDDDLLDDEGQGDEMDGVSATTTPTRTVGGGNADANPSAPSQQFFYKYSAPVRSESEGQTKAIIQQTASRSANRRKQLAALRLAGSIPSSGGEGSNPRTPVPKTSIRLRGAQGKDRRGDQADAGTGLLSRGQMYVNPNQIGEEIREDKKNKPWYMRHALTLAFLRAVRGDKEEDTNATPLEHRSASSPPASASTSTPASVTREGGSRATPPISALMGVNSSSMQRAINEVTHLYFHLSENAPVMTAGSRRGNLPRLEEENNDPELLGAFDVDVKAASPSTEAISEFGERPPRSQHGRTSSVSFSSGEIREDELRISFHAPVIFNQIREFLFLNISQFHEALEHSTWRESLSPGKSGTSLIYFGDYVMKTLPDSDYTMLTTRYLPAYVKYCEQHPHSLLTRFYAIVSVKWLKSGITKCYVLMQNVFTTRNYIHRIYDVKGSTVGRSAIQPGKEPPRTAFGALLLKDNDLPDQLLICGSQQRNVLLKQLRLDLEFLHALSIVDYSMMIGVRSRVLARDKGKEMLANAAAAAKEAEETGKEEDITCLRRCDGGLLSLPIMNEDDTTAREEVYYLGVIDVLQEYNKAKKLENFAKGLYNDRTQISVIPPPEYADRLYHAIARISQ